MIVRNNKKFVAIQFDGYDVNEVREFMGRNFEERIVVWDNSDLSHKVLCITSEFNNCGSITSKDTLIHPNDYIIKDGDYFEIIAEEDFKLNYEIVE